jgi:RAD54-like protein 2
VQRRGHDVFINSLPRKQEFVILLKMTPIQKKLYLTFMECIGAMNPGEKINPLRTFAICCKSGCSFVLICLFLLLIDFRFTLVYNFSVWNHPSVLYKFNQEKEKDNDLDLDIPELQQQIKKRTSKKIK